MNTSGMYRAPQHTDAAENQQPWDYADVKELWKHSRTVLSLAQFFGLMAAIWALVLAAVVLGENPIDPAGALFLAIPLFLFSVGVYALSKRTEWGRIYGAVICALLLLGFPLGTLIGALGLVGLTKGRSLFGPDRPTHKELKARMKEMKRERKAAGRMV